MIRLFGFVFFGLCFAMFIQGGKIVFFEYAPASLFLDVQRFELRDYTYGGDQRLIVERKNTNPLVADYFYKFFCEEEGDSFVTKTEWSKYADIGVPMDSTGGDVVTVYNVVDYPFKLPAGKCYANTEIFFRVGDSYRFAGEFKNEFIVSPAKKLQ